MEFLDHVVILFFNFMRTCHNVFHSGCVIYIPTNNELELHFLRILTNICYTSFLFLRMRNILMYMYMPHLKKSFHQSVDIWDVSTF